MIGAFIYLDMTPRGRNEKQIWVRRHDEYEDAPKSDSCCGEAKQTSAA